MKNFKLYTLLLLAIAVSFTSCDEENELIEERLAENPLPSGITGNPGSVTFSNYVAVGNSLTAGFADNALYNDGQAHSFPALLAQQLQTTGVGGGDNFNQPDINSENGYSGNDASGNPLGRYELSLSQLRPVPTVGEVPTLFSGDQSSLNNFGVPGAKLEDLRDPALGVSNLLYGRFATTPGISTVLGDALATDPTFFTLWIGSNDALGYALSGGTAPLPTDAIAFQSEYTSVLSALLDNGAKGVVINIPPMLTAPFFQAVPYNAVPLDEATATVLNANFAGFNSALDGLVGAMLHDADDANARKVNYAAGQNPILIYDASLENLGPKFDILMVVGAITAQQRAALEPYVQARPATPTDLVLLTASAEIGRDINGQGTVLSGISVPIGDQYILTPGEQANIVTARATYNGIIAGVVQSTNTAVGRTVVAHLDIMPVFADLLGLNTATASALVFTQAGIEAADGVSGLVVDGVSLAPDFSPNGVFSTDGIHPNPRGHGIIANEIINVLNTTFGANIPEVNVLALRGIIATD